MKRFEELVLREPTDPEYLEEHLLRKGAGLLFAAQSKTRGNKAEQHFKNAMSMLNTSAGVSDSERLDSFGRALTEVSKGLIETRHQIGALTSVAVTGVVLSERKSKR